MKPALELHKQRIPRRLLWLDALGAVLVAIGILELLQAGPRLLPEALRFSGLAIALVVIGSTAMLAVPVWLLRQHRRRQRDFTQGRRSHEP
jgi:uncharacterized membrane protein